MKTPNLADDIKEANELAKHDLSEITAKLTADGAIQPVPAPPPPTVDPKTRAMHDLREQIDEGALKIWATKAPKEVGGTILAALVNGKIVMVHQMDSGKYGVFIKSPIRALADEPE